MGSGTVVTHRALRWVLISADLSDLPTRQSRRAPAACAWPRSGHCGDQVAWV